jgi:hypothetical protein
MTATVLDLAHYQAWVDDLWLHGCEALAVPFEQWCTACREES